MGPFLLKDNKKKNNSSGVTEVGTQDSVNKTRLALGYEAGHGVGGRDYGTGAAVLSPKLGEKGQ